MKKLFTFLFLLCAASFMQAQWQVNSFDSAVADGIFTTAQSGSGSVTLTELTTGQHDGAGALQIDYVVHSSESYGGYTQLIAQVPQSDSTHTYMDWSSAKSLRLWYNVVTPPSDPTVEFRMQIYESGGDADYWNSGAHEAWYYNQGTTMLNSTPGWNSLVIPLKDLGEISGASADGFSLNGWSGTRNNGVLDLNKVTGYVLEFETPGIAGNGSASGTVIFDKLELFETSYPPVETFDNVASTASYYTIDKMEWAGGAELQSSLALTDVTGDDTFEGLSTLKVDYTVNNSQSWGGYANFEHVLADGAKYNDLSGNTDLILYIKVLSPATGTPGAVTLRFFLYDGPEWWQIAVPVDLYTASGWQQIKLPLEDKGYSASAIPSDGFVVPSWTVDQGHAEGGGFNLSNIVGYKFEFTRVAGEPLLELGSGSVMIDLMTPAGFRETDNTPPQPPTDLIAVNGNYINLVTWSDVPGETAETYSVYYSDKQITATFPDEDPSLEVVGTSLPEGNPLVNHLLRAPGTDQSVTYYYGVSARDKAGNIGQLAVSGPVTNTAKGVPTITKKTIENFNADGDLSEWIAAGLTPIHMSVPGATGFLAANTFVDDDADLSSDTYLAIDDTYLYVAFDVTDNVVVFREDLASYLNDSPDLFIGLYNWHGAPHGSLRRGAEPDYHLRFTKTRLLNEGGNGNADSLVLPGTNYYWDLSFTGYVVEARIPLADLANKRNAGNTNFDNLFVPKEGMRIPLDMSINDNDTPTGTVNREGIMCYSPNNNDQSYSTTARWVNTWIGDKWVVGVNDNKVQPIKYSLDQNYPNPFNPSTQIKYSIEKSGMVSIKVFDMLGREVRELVNQNQNAGSYIVNFDASDLSTGVYVYQLNSGSFQSAKKMLLIK